MKLQSIYNRLLESEMNVSFSSIHRCSTGVELYHFKVSNSNGRYLASINLFVEEPEKSEVRAMQLVFGKKGISLYYRSSEITINAFVKMCQAIAFSLETDETSL